MVFLEEWVKWVLILRRLAKQVGKWLLVGFFQLAQKNRGAKQAGIRRECVCTKCYYCVFLFCGSRPRRVADRQSTRTVD